MLRVQTGRWGNRALLRTLDGRQAVRWPRDRETANPLGLLRRLTHTVTEEKEKKKPGREVRGSVFRRDRKPWSCGESSPQPVSPKTCPNSLLASHISFQHPPTTFSGGVTQVIRSLCCLLISLSHTHFLNPKLANSWRSPNLFCCCVKHTHVDPHQSCYANRRAGWLTYRRCHHMESLLYGYRGLKH